MEPSPLPDIADQALTPAEARTFQFVKQLTEQGQWWNPASVRRLLDSPMALRHLRRLARLGVIADAGWKILVDQPPLAEPVRAERDDMPDADDLSASAQGLLRTIFDLDRGSQSKWFSPDEIRAAAALDAQLLSRGVQRLHYLRLIRRNYKNGRYSLTRAGVLLADHLTEVETDDRKLRAQDGSGESTSRDEIS